MKNKTTSFLFFLVISLLFGNEYIFSQIKIDSIDYYTNEVQRFKNADILIKAKVFFEKKLNSISKDNVQTLFYKYNIASIEKKIGNYLESEIMLVDILNSIDQFESTEFRNYYQKSSLNLIGNIYRDQKNKEKALELFERALKKANSSKDSVVIYNNMSNIFKDFKEYNNSKKTLLLAFDLLPKIKDTTEIARVYDNLGFALSKLDNPTGLEFLMKGLELRTKLNDRKGLYSSYKQLAIHHNDNQNDSLAQFYAIQAFNISKEINTPDFREDALGLLVDLSNYDYAKQYKRLNDSLSEARKLRANKYAMYRYDKTQSEKEKELEERKTLLFAFLGGFIFIGAIFFIFLQRNRNKRHTLAQIHKTERNLSKKVHDELGNDIFYLMNQLETNPASLLEKEGLQILNGLNEIYVKARDISKKYTSIDTCEGYHDELLALLNSFGNATTKIVTNEIAPDFWQPVSTLKKEQLYRVLQELLTNMKKHSEAAFVGITFTKIKKQIIVKYVDNGKGVTKEKLLTKGGLKNVENRIAEIKGTITFDTSPDNGLKVEIRFIQ